MVACSAAVKRKIRQPEADGPAAAPPREVLRCGALRVDAAARQAWLDGTLLDLQPKVFDLLLLLLREPRVVHTRDALFHRLWPGAVVLDATLTAAISQLRRAFDEPNRALLRTVPKVGYAFDGEVEVEAEDRAPTDVPMPAEADAAAEPAAADPTQAPASPGVTSAPRPAVAPPFRRAAPALLAVLVLAVLVAIGLGWGPRPGEARPILVLGPIQPEAGAVGSRWLALALRDGLLRRLGAEPALRVVDHADAVGASLVAGARSGTAAGADFLLEVDYAPGPSLQAPIALVLRLRDARDATETWRAARTAPPAELLLEVDALADAVRARILPGHAPPARPVTVPVAAVDAYTEGLRALARADYREARRELERAVQLAPGFAAAELRLAEVLRELGQQSLAAAIYRRIAATGDDPSSEATRVARARALALDGAHAEAASAFRALVADHPDEPRHGIELARALAQRDAAGRQEARTILQQLAPRTSLAEWNIRRLMALGLVEELDGRHADAAAAFGAARDVADAAGLAGHAGADVSPVFHRPILSLS